MTREPCPTCARPEATDADWNDTEEHPPGCECDRCAALCWGGTGCRDAADSPPPADAGLLASANRELHAHLRDHPKQAFEVARQLRAAGPWEPDDYDQAEAHEAPCAVQE